LMCDHNVTVTRLRSPRFRGADPRGIAGGELHFFELRWRINLGLVQRGRGTCCGDLAPHDLSILDFGSLPDGGSSRVAGRRRARARIRSAPVGACVAYLTLRGWTGRWRSRHVHVQLALPHPRWRTMMNRRLESGRLVVGRSEYPGAAGSAVFRPRCGFWLGERGPGRVGPENPPGACRFPTGSG